ncbi:MAG: HAMP domain-containing protein, partial [Janthinobacterium lividum]
MVFTVVVSLVALSGIASYHLSGVLAEAADRQAQSGRLVIAAKDALAAAVDLSSHLRGLVMTHAPDNVPDIVKDQERFTARIADARASVPLAAGLSAEIDAFQDSESLWHRQFVDVVLPLASSNAAADQAQASALMVAETNRRMVGDIRAAAARVLATAQRLTETAAASHADALTAMRGSSLATTLIVALVAMGLSWWLSRAIGTPVSLLTASMRGLAEGDLDTAVPGTERRDEIGAMATSLEVFKLAAIEKARLEADALSAGRLTEAERARVAAVQAEAA